MSQPLRVLLSSTSLNVQQDIEALYQSLPYKCQGCVTKLMGLTELPNFICTTNQLPCDVLVLSTRGTPPNIYLVQDLQRLAAMGCLVVCYPNPISKSTRAFQTALTEEELLRLIAARRLQPVPQQTLAYQPGNSRIMVASPNNPERLPLLSRSQATSNMAANRGAQPIVNLTPPIQTSQSVKNIEQINGRVLAVSDSSKDLSIPQQPLAVANGNGPSRPMSSLQRSLANNYRIRLESVRRVNSPNKIGDSPTVCVLDVDGGPLQTFVGKLSLKVPAFKLIDLDLNKDLPPGTILIASYERRRQLKMYLTTKNPPISCVLIGNQLLPDGIVNMPQIDFITHSFVQVQQYLFDRGLVTALNPTLESHSVITVQPPPTQVVTVNNPPPAVLPSVKSVRFIQDQPQKIAKVQTYETASPNKGALLMNSQVPLSANLQSPIPYQALPPPLVGGVTKEWIVNKRPNGGDFLVTSVNEFKHQTTSSNLFQLPKDPPNKILAPSSQLPIQSKMYAPPLNNNGIVPVVNTPSLQVVSPLDQPTNQHNFSRPQSPTSPTYNEWSPNRRNSRKVINLADVDISEGPNADSTVGLMGSNEKRQQRFTLTKANMPSLGRSMSPPIIVRPTSPVNILSPSNVSILNDQSNGSVHSSASNALTVHQTSIAFRKKRKVVSKDGMESELGYSSEQDPSHSSRTSDLPALSRERGVEGEGTAITNATNTQVDYKIPVGNNFPIAESTASEEIKPLPPRMNGGYYSPSNYIISEEINQNESLVLDKNNVHSNGNGSLTYNTVRVATYGNPEDRKTYKNSKPSRANILENSHEDVSSMMNSMNVAPTPSSSEMKTLNANIERMLPESGQSSKNNTDRQAASSPLSSRERPVNSKYESEFPVNSYCAVSESNPKSAMEQGRLDKKQIEKSPLARHFANKSEKNLRSPVLFLLAKGLEHLRPKLQALVSERDKLRYYSRISELKDINYPSYSVVFLIPREDERLPDVLEPNVYVIHLVRHNKKFTNHELFVRDVRELGSLIGSINADQQPQFSKSSDNYDWNLAQENIRKYNTRAKVLFPGSQVELEQGIYRKLIDRVVPVKYFDGSALADRVKHFHNDRLVVVIVGGMMRSIRELRQMASNISFVVIERAGRSVSREDDVKFASDVPQALHFVEGYLQPHQ